jgi:hypothetical protein
MIFFEDSYLTISIDEYSQCLIQTWKGYARSEQFRKGIEASIELFQQQKLSKIVSNTKDFAVAQKEDTDWVASYATPILVEYGLKYMAFVMPVSSFAQVSVYNFKSQTDKMITIKYFVELDHARTWIDSVDDSFALVPSRLTAVC